MTLVAAADDRPGSGARAADSDEFHCHRKKPMRYRTLGKTNYRVSTVSFGAWAVGGCGRRRRRRRCRRT